MSFIDSIKNFFKKREIIRRTVKNVIELAPTPEIIEALPEAVKKENIELKAKVAVLQEALSKIRNELKQETEVNVDEEIINQALQKENEHKSKTIDIAYVMKQLDKKEVKLYSKDNKYLGNLKTIEINEGLIVIKGVFEGKEYIVARGYSFDEIVNHAESMSDQLMTGTLRLNRYYDDPSLIPDIEVPINYAEVLSGEEKATITKENTDKIILNLKRRVNEYYAKIKQLEIINNKLMFQNKDLQISNDLNKHKAETMEMCNLNIINAIKGWLPVMTDISSKQVVQAEQEALTERINDYNQEKLRNLLKEIDELRGKPDYDIILNQIKRAIGTIIPLTQKEERLKNTPSIPPIPPKQIQQIQGEGK